MLVIDPAVPGGVRAKLLDFGIAKMLGDTLDRPSVQTQTRTGALMGTPVYMSPEQCRGAGGVGDRSDVYSLGVVMFHILTGTPPFQAVGTGELMAKHMSEPPPRLLTTAPEVSEPLASLVDQMLRKEPTERPTMAEIELELARQSGVPIGSLVTGAQPIALTSREQVRTGAEAVASVDPFRSTIGGVVAQTSQPARPKRSRFSLRLLAAGLLGGLAITGVVGVSMWRSGIRTADLLHQAQAEAQARRWDEAEAHLTEAMTQRGINAEQRRMAEKLRLQISSERVAREILDSMEGLEKTGQPEESARLFRKLPADSVYVAAGKEVYERAAARLLASHGGALESTRQAGRCDEWQRELQRITDAIGDHPALLALRTRGCVATQLTEPEQRTRAEATELLQRWLAAHNLGRATELPTLYAARALGVRYLNGRMLASERERWLAERAERLRSPTSLALTGEAHVVAIASAALLSFPYSWESSAHKEAGRAELLLLREPSGLRIAREEHIPAQLLPQAASTHPTEQLAFLGGMDLLLPTPVDEAWLVGVPTMEPGTDPLRISRDIDPAKLPPDVLRWRGRSVELWDLSGRRCEARVVAFKVIGRLRPNAVLTQRWQATSSEIAATEAWRLSAAGRSLGAVLEGDPAACAGALWARAIDHQPVPKLGTLREAPLPLRALAMRELSKLPLGRELQALVPRRPGVRGWQDGKETSLQILTLQLGPTQLLSASIKIGTGCAGVSHQFWVLWRRQPDGRTYKLVTAPRGLPGGVPRAVVDFDNNGEPEVLFSPGGLGELFGILRAKNGVYSELEIDRVPALDSGC